MAKLNCTRDDAFAILFMSLIYARKESIEGCYRLRFNDPKRSDEPFEVYRIVTDDTEHLTKSKVEKELKTIKKEGLLILTELRVLS